MEAQNIEDEDCIPNFENLDEEVRKLRQSSTIILYFN